MSDAILTKFRHTGPKGARILASNQWGRVFVAYDHALTAEENHAAAARALLAKVRGETNRWVLESGRLESGVYAHVPVARKAYQPATNGEGLTFEEWCAAAGRAFLPSARSTSYLECSAAWIAGEDPTEHRV